MEAVIRKWGNDLGIRIPIGVAEKLSLKTGYRVCVVPLGRKPARSLESLLAGVTKDNIHGEISFGMPVGKEIW
jgi:antitoxin MazE